MVELYGARPGHVFEPLARVWTPGAAGEPRSPAVFFVAGVWRDYVRQFGAITMDARDFERLTGERLRVLDDRIQARCARADASHALKPTYGCQRVTALQRNAVAPALRPSRAQVGGERGKHDETAAENRPEAFDIH